MRPFPPEAVDSHELAELYQAAERDPELRRKLQQVVDSHRGVDDVPDAAYEWPPRIVLTEDVRRKNDGDPVPITNGFERVVARYIRPAGPAHLVEYQGQTLVAHEARHAGPRRPEVLLDRLVRIFDEGLPEQSHLFEILVQATGHHFFLNFRRLTAVRDLRQ